MFRRIKDIIAMNKAVGQYEEIRKEIDSMNKIGVLLRSKRLWVSVVGLALTLSDIMPVKVAAALTMAATIGTKIIDMGILSDN